MKYYMLVEEWLYPTESGREPRTETFDSLPGALVAAMDIANSERPNFSDNTGCDALPAGLGAPLAGDLGHAIITAGSGGTEDDAWFYVVRAFAIEGMPSDMTGSADESGS